MRIPVKWPAGGVAAKFIRQARCSEARLPSPNRPETQVADAEYQDARLAGSGGTNPARRFCTRLPVALRPHSNSNAIVSPFISQADQALKILARSRFLQ